MLNDPMFLALYGLLYFVPAIVAAARNHPHRAPIFVLTLLLGWTYVGWVVALVWSLVNSPSRTAAATS